jgi:hypothetical protein
MGFMNVSRTTKILGFSVPPTVVQEVESFAKEERRTKSELFREMVRVYGRYRQQRDRDENRWVSGLIEETKAELARRPAPVEEMLKESSRLSQYGARQAKKLGIKPNDVDRIVHENRKARQRA